MRDALWKKHVYYVYYNTSATNEYRVANGQGDESLKIVLLLLLLIYPFIFVLEISKNEIDDEVLRPPRLDVVAASHGRSLKYTLLHSLRLHGLGLHFKPVEPVAPVPPEGTPLDVEMGAQPSSASGNV